MKPTAQESVVAGGLLGRISHRSSSGGDIAMLEYSQPPGRPSLQLMVNHDDAEREFAYGEKNHASLTAAREHGWHVVSIKRDWRTVFALPER